MFTASNHVTAVAPITTFYGTNPISLNLLVGLQPQGITSVSLYWPGSQPGTNINDMFKAPTSDMGVFTIKQPSSELGDWALRTRGFTQQQVNNIIRLFSAAWTIGPQRGFGAAVVSNPEPFFGLAYLLPFQITAPPAYLPCYEGLNASLSVGTLSADGSPLYYQWSQNGVPIAGATNATLTVSNVQPANAGVYLVRVSLTPGDTNADTVLMDGGLMVLEPFTFTAAQSGYYAGLAASCNGASPGVFMAATSYEQILFMGSNNATTVAAGTMGGYGYQDGTNALFAGPQGLALDASNNLYVADTGNNVIREFSGGITTTIAGNRQTNGLGIVVGGWRDGAGTNALFNQPYCVALDGLGRIYVGDFVNSVVRMLTWTGSNYLVTTIAGVPGTTGFLNGPGTNAWFSSIYGLAADAVGNVFVADGNNNVVRMIDTNRMVTTAAGLWGNSGSADGIGSNARFGRPTGIAMRPDGSLLVVDATFGTIRKMIPLGTNWLVTTLSSGQFIQPRAVATDCAGTIYVSDPGYYSKGLNSVFRGLPGTSPPAIIAQPQPQTQVAGGDTTLNVVVSNASPVTYQWLFNGVAMPGQTGATLSLSGLARTNEGVYQVVVTGTNGALVSSATMVRVLVPTVLQPPVPQGTNGTVSVFFAGADGGLPDDLNSVQVQWRASLPSGTDTNWQILLNYPYLFGGYVGVDDTNGVGPVRVYRVLQR